ncbi:MAG TPA: type IV pilus twitching motility protein PilT [Acidobacteriota bacterium]
MTPAQQFMEALVKFGGERLVIGSDEPPFIWRNEKKGYLLREPLNDDLIRKIDEELLAAFAGKEWLSYLGQEIGHSRENGAIHLKMAASQKQVGAGKIREITAVPEVPTLNGLLGLMVEKKASDLHLSTGCPPYLRVDGEIEVIAGQSHVTEAWLKTQIEAIMPERNRSEFAGSQDTDFAYEIVGLARFRVNVLRDQRGLGAVLRCIPSRIVPAAELNIPKVVLDLCSMPKGLILVTGPTGSGKSTTLAALVDHINSTRAGHIITIEDPVEFIHPNKRSLVNQREVGTHTASFKKSLRAALREDPDVILVGEMRDLETIAIAVEMAVTGHLVLGTLHTSTACGTVDRIIDQFPSDQQNQIRTMLADALVGVVSQMLCRKKEGGRAAAYEVMVVNVAVANLIREGKTFQIPAMMQTGKSFGMRMMNDCLNELVEKGTVTVEEALAKAIDKESLRARLRSRGLLVA